MKRLFYKILYSLVIWFTYSLEVGAVETGPDGGCGEGFTNFKCAVKILTEYVNYLIILVIGLAVLLFLFGMLKYITAGGDETQLKEAKNFIIFGIIGLAVMVAVWGLVRMLVGFFFEDTSIFIPQIKGQ
jgi:hypothetical protein